MIQWMEYLHQAVDAHASDIFFVAGGPVCVKQDGHLHRMDTPRLLPPDPQQIAEEIYAAAKRSIDHFLRTGKITADTALHFVDHPEQIKRNLN